MKLRQIQICFFTFMVFLFSCQNNKTNIEQEKAGLRFNFIEFTTLKTAESPKTKFLAVDVYNNQDTSVFFMDSLMFSPESVHIYLDDKLLGRSFAENWSGIFVEIPPYKRDTFYMSPRFRGIEPEANIFEFYMCYHLSAFAGAVKECQKLKYKMNGYNIEEIEPAKVFLLRSSS